MKLTLSCLLLRKTLIETICHFKVHAALSQRFQHVTSETTHTKANTKKRMQLLIHINVRTCLCVCMFVCLFGFVSVCARRNLFHFIPTQLSSPAS